MICNISKTELIAFGVEELEVEFGMVKIKSKDTMKVLGILIDNKLSFEPHIQKVLKSCRSQMFALRYFRQKLSMKDVFKEFRAHIISKLTYCSPAWCCNLSYLLKAKLK